jgi:hypothetical protein
MTQAFPKPPPCEVIVLTALPVECQAVLHFLQQPQLRECRNRLIEPGVN